MENPFNQIKYLLSKIIRSMGFMSTFVMVMRSFYCFSSYIGIKFNFWGLVFHSMFVTLGVLLEDVHRIEDYGIYTLPRVIEGLWDYFRHIGYVKDIKFSMQIIFAISIGIMLVLNKFYSKDMPPTYRSQVNFIFGLEEEKKKVG